MWAIDLPFSGNRDASTTPSEGKAKGYNIEGWRSDFGTSPGRRGEREELGGGAIKKPLRPKKGEGRGDDTIRSSVLLSNPSPIRNKRPKEKQKDDWWKKNSGDERKCLNSYQLYVTTQAQSDQRKNGRGQNQEKGDQISLPGRISPTPSPRRGREERMQGRWKKKETPRSA